MFSTLSTFGVWINIVEEKVKIGSLHNPKKMSKKIDQIFQKCKKVIHIRKHGKYGKIGVINEVIHFIHIKNQKKTLFRSLFSKQVFCDILINLAMWIFIFKKILTFQMSKNEEKCRKLSDNLKRDPNCLAQGKILASVLFNGVDLL